MADFDLVDVHRRALADTGRLVANVSPDDYGKPTPCDDWDVQTLLNHVISGNHWVGELMAGKTIEEVGDRLDGDMVGDDPGAAWEASARVADSGFSKDGAMEMPVAVSYGPVPGEVYAGHRFIDVLIHGWDLARGTGQSDVLDAELVDACLAVVEPQQELLSGSGAFATCEIPDDADPQTRLLAMLGRA
jgi:uncharacterized protein (TIGR03086 family)